MKIKTEKTIENYWMLIGDNGRMLGHLEKDGYNIWFVTEEQETSYSAEELEAIAAAMKELK